MKATMTTDLTYATGESFDFEDNFEVIRHSGYRVSALLMYIDYGQLKGEYDIEQDVVIEDTRENRVKIKRYITKEGWAVVSELEGVLSELRDYEDISDYEDVEDLRTILDDLGIDHTSYYACITSTGYSQGDYVQILINTKEFEKLTGSKFNPDLYRKEFDHYLWDSRIYGYVNLKIEYCRNAVNIAREYELPFDEWCKDGYEAELDVEMLMNYLKTDLPYPITPEEEKVIRDEVEKLDYTDVKYPCSC